MSLKIYAVENLIGIASLMVLIWHVGTLNHGLNLFFLNNFQLGVQMFFVISGFIIPFTMYQNNYKINNFKQFILKRISRIEPPYLISIVITIVASWLIYPDYRRINWLDLLLHIGYLIPFFKNAEWVHHIYWTLAIEFQFYLIIALLYPVIFKSHKYISIFICLLLLLTVFINVPSFKNGELIFRHIHFFSIGIFTWLFYIKK